MGKKGSFWANYYNCILCESIFAGQRALEKHYQISHQSEPNEDIFKKNCYICSRKIPSLKSLIVHISHVHNNSKYECLHCEKLYCDLESFYMHITKYHKYDYKCCFSKKGQIFDSKELKNTKSDLKKSEKSIHANKNMLSPYLSVKESSSKQSDANNSGHLKTDALDQKNSTSNSSLFLEIQKSMS